MGGDEALPHFQVLVGVVDHRFLELLRMCQKEFNVRRHAPGSAPARFHPGTPVCPYWLRLGCAFPDQGAVWWSAWPVPWLPSGVCSHSLPCALNAGAQPFRTRPIESACKNGHNGEHVANQLFGWLLDLGLIEDCKRGHVATQTPGRDS